MQENETTQTIHKVSSLWCSAVKGYMALAQILVEFGKADVNSTSDSGSTPIRSACFMNKIEIVKYLVKNGANINKPNLNGGTCLINSVQNLELCQFLISNGAEINAQDMHGKTALHYTVHENKTHTMRVLIMVQM
ncbi:unnamed protein product [Gordionus sp. m RMFG-2023]